MGTAAGCQQQRHHVEAESRLDAQRRADGTTVDTQEEETKMPLVCSTCGRADAPNYFKVTKVARDGTESHLTLVCSATCLMKWVYSFTALQGARLAYGAKSAFQQIVDLIKGR
jgi:hypothetical protein